MGLNNELLELLKNEGCTIVGFADLRSLPAEDRRQCNCGIIIALPLSKEAMQENLKDNPQRYEDEHEPMNQRFRVLKGLIADFLAGKGYETQFDIPLSLPLKTIGTLSGIGWIGKNAILVTHEAGSAVRLAAVLTNAPFTYGTPITASLCGPDCVICADICPGQAVSGNLWKLGIEQKSFFNASACRDAARARGKRLINIDGCMCGLCISACPNTKRKLGYYTANG